MIDTVKIIGEPSYDERQREAERRREVFLADVAMAFYAPALARPPISSPTGTFSVLPGDIVYVLFDAEMGGPIGRRSREGAFVPMASPSAPPILSRATTRHVEPFPAAAMRTDWGGR